MGVLVDAGFAISFALNTLLYDRWLQRLQVKNYYPGKYLDYIKGVMHSAI